MGSYISRVISRVTIVITYIRGLITPVITTHEPPSNFKNYPYTRLSTERQVGFRIEGMLLTILTTH